MTRRIAAALLTLSVLAAATQAQAAVTTVTRYQYAAVTPTKDGSAFKACNSNEVLVGGGFDATSKDVFVLNSMPVNNAWWVYARNVGSGTKYVYSFAVCASGDSNASSWGHSELVYVNAGGTGTADPACGDNGKAAAGGFYSYSDSTSFVATQTLPDISNNTKWITSFRNYTSSQQKFTGVVLCVKDLNASFSNVYDSSGINIPASSTGYTSRSCSSSSVATGSGFNSDIGFHSGNQWVYGARGSSRRGFVRGNNANSSDYMSLFSYVKCMTPS